MYTNFTFCFSFWGLRPPAPYWGFAPGPHHMNPSIVESWVRLWRALSQYIHGGIQGKSTVLVLLKICQWI